MCTKAAKSQAPLCCLRICAACTLPAPLALPSCLLPSCFSQKAERAMAAKCAGTTCAMSLQDTTGQLSAQLSAGENSGLADPFAAAYRRQRINPTNTLVFVMTVTDNDKTVSVMTHGLWLRRIPLRLCSLRWLDA